MGKHMKFCFERYEKKYFLTPTKQEIFIKEIEKYMQADVYGKYTVCNIYYDTDDYRLIRASIEKPTYKEKLRVRSYGVARPENDVFVELKKKCYKVVYKRRITMKENLVKDFLNGSGKIENTSQIAKEILWFQNIYHSKPKVFIAYDRIAFAGKYNPDLRVTFDTRIRWRDKKLSLCAGDFGKPIIDDDRVLMEIKMPGVCPLWLSHLLDELKIYPTSFSKYGTCYKNFIVNKRFECAEYSNKSKEVCYSA